MKKKLLLFLVSIIILGCSSAPEVIEEVKPSVMTFEEHFSEDFYFSDLEIKYADKINTEVSRQILPVISVETSSENLSSLKNISGMHILKGNTVNIEDSFYTSFRLKDRINIDNSSVKKEYKIKNSPKSQLFIQVRSNGGTVSVNNNVVETDAYIPLEEDVVVTWELSKTSEIRIDLVLYSDDSTESLDFDIDMSSEEVYNSQYSYILANKAVKENFVSAFSVPEDLKSLRNSKLYLNIDEVVWNNFELFEKSKNIFSRLDMGSSLNDVLSNDSQIVLFPKNIPNSHLDNSNITLDVMFDKPKLDDKVINQELEANSLDIKKSIYNTFYGYDHHFYEVPGIVNMKDVSFDDNNIKINILYYSSKAKIDETMDFPLLTLTRKISDKEDEFNLTTDMKHVNKYMKKPRFIRSVLQVVPAVPGVYEDYEFFINENATEEQVLQLR